MGEYKEIIWTSLAFIIALGISYFTTPIVNILARRMGAVDIPRDERRMHTEPIPRLGGLAIFFGFICSAILFVPMNPQVQGILLGAVLIVIIGVIDDIVSLSAPVKLVGQILTAIFPVMGGVRIEVLTNFNIFSDNPYIIFGNLAVPITIIWIVGITNAVNLIDGLDGLAVGISSIASISLFVIAILVSENMVAMIVAALAGACIGFMPYNINPAKMFMGDTGAMFLGYILGTVSILGLFKFYAVISFAVPFLILGLPIFDTGFAIVRRLLKGRSPMSPDRGHLHHRLIDMGFTQKQTVGILYAMSAILGLSAVVLTGSGALKALLLIFTVILVSFVAYKIFEIETQNKRNAESSDQKSDPDANDDDV